MSEVQTAGARLRAALDAERPLQVVGAVNAYAALLAQQAGFKALYLSGAGVANASFGLPDLGMTTLNDVCEDMRRITGASELPLLVDADTGWGGAFNIARTARELIRAGAAGMHLEDQVAAKRCGHRPGKALVAAAEMCDRIKAAVDGRTDAQFVIMARTDAHAVEGQAAAIERAAGLRRGRRRHDLRRGAHHAGRIPRSSPRRVQVPVLANITEFGQTPLFTREELGAAGVRLVLYPLSAFRAMSQGAVEVYEAIRKQGTQQGVRALHADARRALRRCSATTSTRRSSTSCSAKGRSHE